MADLNENIKKISENENVQKAKNIASNAGKKLDENITNAVEGIKSSDTYNKVMNNENVQKAKNVASNAGKKLDENITNAVEGIKGSDTYNKVVNNEKFQKVMNSNTAKKATGFWKKLGKKSKYIVGAVATAVVVLSVTNLFGGNTTKLKSENSIKATKCSYKCKAGKVGFSSASETSGTLYFSAKDENKVYKIESEDNQETETTTAESKIYGRDDNGSSLFKYDTKLSGEDTNGNGYVEYTISVYNGRKYKKVCTIKGKTK